MTKFVYYTKLYEKLKTKELNEKDKNLKKFFRSAAEGFRKKILNLKPSEYSEIIQTNRRRNNDENF